MVVMKREKERLLATEDVATEISELLSRVAIQICSTFGICRKALAIARKINNSTLAHICTKELSGWNSSDTADESFYRPTYRLIEVFCRYPAAQHAV